MDRTYYGLCCDTMASGSVAEYVLKRVIIGAVVLLALTLAVFVPLSKQGGAIRGSPAAGPIEGAGSRVTLTIRFPGDRVHQFGLVYVEGMTVLDAMNAAAAAGGPPPPLAFGSRGTGEMAFLESIEGLANEGGASGARNWILWVNGRQATAGMGATVLRAGDRVDWVFQPYTPDAQARPPSEPIKAP